ncbi:hypothetical protein KC361_g3739 [Hortaea werneckii]|nr:hypothetical protein KC361_g3739 [Hortaea werneckii]
MAPTKERSKANRKTPGGDAAVLKNTGATKKVTKGLSKNARPIGRDLFTTLPAELRNKIYELTLVEEKIFVVGSVKSQRPPYCLEDLSPVANTRLTKLRRGYFQRRRFSREDTHALRILPWTEPGLLQVCHSVREEASKMYYGSNKFVAKASLIDFAKLGAWLKTLGRRCGPEPLSKFRISVTSASWLGLHNAMDLAKAIHSSGIRLQPLDSPFWANSWSLEGSNRVVQLYHEYQKHMEGPLNEALGLCQQANSQGRSKSWLTRRLNVWLHGHLRTYRVRRALKGMDVSAFEDDVFVGVKVLRRKERKKLKERKAAVADGRREYFARRKIAEARRNENNLSGQADLVKVEEINDYDSIH